MIITLVQTIIFFSYLIYITSRFGIIHSISESWYKLEDKLRILFTLFCWGIGIPMIEYITSNDTGVLFFLSATGFAFVGAATMFKSRAAYTHLVHYIGSAMGIIFALIGLGVDYNLWVLSYTSVPIAIAMTILYFKNKLKNVIWWIELVAAVAILTGLWLTHL